MNRSRSLRLSLIEALKKGWPLLLVLVLLALITSRTAAPVLASTGHATRQIVVEAHQFEYKPTVIRVGRGESIRLVLRSMDVTHGLSLEGYGISLRAPPGREAQAEFSADRPGKFVFRCNQVCGNLHPFMTGSLVVEPNRPLWFAYALAALLALGFVGYVGVKGGRAVAPQAADNAGAVSLPAGAIPLAGATRDVSWDLARFRMVRRLLLRRVFQFALLLPTLFFLVLVLVVGFAGSPVGGHNLAIVLVWSVWWPLLILVLIPVGGRAWCAACPLPAPGEWLQRLSLVRRREGRPFSLGWSWPRHLRNRWPQTLSFLAVATVSVVVLTSPFATAIALSTFVGLAILTALLFRGRVFCRYVCPLGGFIGLYSLVASFVLKVKDPQVCRAHSEKSCVEGNRCGYGCPWFQYPGTMERSVDCGLCTECVKTCPLDNIAVGFQAPGRDLVRTQGRADEAFRAIIDVLAVALFFTAVKFGPWGWARTWAGNPATVGYLAYVGLLVGTSLFLIPGLLLLAAYLSRRLSAAGGVTVSQLWVDFAYSFVPLGLLVWMTFAVTAFLAGAVHVPTVLSDPLGRGWNLFGTADVRWPPLLPWLLLYLQVGGPLAGLAWSLTVLWRRAEGLLAHEGAHTWLGLIPMAVLLSGTSLVFLWLFLG